MEANPVANPEAKPIAEAIKVMLAIAVVNLDKAANLDKAVARANKSHPLIFHSHENKIDNSSRGCLFAFLRLSRLPCQGETVPSTRDRGSARTYKLFNDDAHPARAHARARSPQQLRFELPLPPHRSLIPRQQADDFRQR